MDGTNNKENGQNRKPKLYAFPGGANDTSKQPPIKGPVWGSPRLYRCKKCGNTRIFNGFATVNALLTISAVRPFEYDILEYSLSDDMDVDHYVVSCGKCGSFEVETYEVNLSIPSLREKANGETRRVIPIFNDDVDPLPPDPIDIEFPEEANGSFCVTKSDEARKTVPKDFPIGYDPELEAEWEAAGCKDVAPENQGNDDPFDGIDLNSLNFDPDDELPF